MCAFFTLLKYIHALVALTSTLCNRNFNGPWSTDLSMCKFFCFFFLKQQKNNTNNNKMLCKKAFFAIYKDIIINIGLPCLPIKTLANILSYFPHQEAVNISHGFLTRKGRTNKPLNLQLETRHRSN